MVTTEKIRGVTSGSGVTGTVSLAGTANKIAAIGSFIAGTIATLIIAALGVPLTRMALLFGPAEYFSLMVLGLAFATVLARGSVFKAVAMIVLGLLLATVGTDLETGEERLTFGVQRVADGIDFAVLAMGVFGFAEVLRTLDSKETRDVVTQAIGRLAKEPRQASLVYVSDHGESLGEGGLFLHGMPYSFAPAVQKEVPMVLWANEQAFAAQRVDRACLQAKAAQPHSHDHLFHTLMAWAGVSSPSTYLVARDAAASCRQP